MGEVCFQAINRPTSLPLFSLFFLFSFFFRAHAIEEALRKDRCSAEKGTESTKKGEGEQQQKEKLSPLPFKLIINAAQ